MAIANEIPGLLFTHSIGEKCRSDAWPRLSRPPIHGFDEALVCVQCNPEGNGVPLASGRETEVVDRVSERAANDCPLLGTMMGGRPLLGMLDPAQP